MSTSQTRQGGSDAAVTPASASKSFSDAAYLGVLAGAWLLALLVVDVRGDFPENDGWAHARTLEMYLETGRIERLEWTFAVIVTNTLWGALFAEPFGPSFTVMRVSSLVMGLFGLLGVYALARVLGQRKGLAALHAGTYGFGAMHLALSYTFMSDVPYTTLIVWSLVAFAHGLKRRKVWPYAIGLALTIGAALSRQTGVVLLATVTLVLAISLIRSARSFLVAGIGAIGLVALALFVERALLRGETAGVVIMIKSALLGNAPFYTLIRNGSESLICLGVSSLPVVAWMLSREVVTPRLVAIGGLVGLTAITFTAWKQPHLPFFDNLLDRGGIGPIMIHCASERPMFPAWIMWAATFIGAISGGLALALACRSAYRVAWPERHDNPEKLLLLATVVTYLAPLCLRRPFFARYLIAILPARLVMIALSAGKAYQARASSRVGAVVAVALAIVRTLAVADYLGHHRLREALYRPLLDRGVSPSAIEAGFEFDGYYRYDRESDHPVSGRGSREEYMNRVEENRWLVGRTAALHSSGPSWSEGDRYLVSYCPAVSGYSRISETSRPRFLPPGEDRLFLHERNGANATR
jgi:hypothetical protein